MSLLSMSFSVSSFSVFVSLSVSLSVFICLFLSASLFVFVSLFHWVPGSDEVLR